MFIAGLAFIVYSLLMALGMSATKAAAVTGIGFAIIGFLLGGRVNKDR